MSDVRHERRFRDFRGTFRLPSKTRRESGHSGSAGRAIFGLMRHSKQHLSIRSHRRRERGAAFAKYELTHLLD